MNQPITEATETKEQTMSLEEYKKRLEDYLLKTRHFSTETVNELMTDYGPALPQYLADGWDVATMGAAMANNF